MACRAIFAIDCPSAVGLSRLRADARSSELDRRKCEHDATCGEERSWAADTVRPETLENHGCSIQLGEALRLTQRHNRQERKDVGEGKRGYIRVDRGGRRHNKQK